MADNETGAGDSGAPGDGDQGDQVTPPATGDQGDQGGAPATGDQGKAEKGGRRSEAQKARRRELEKKQRQEARARAEARAKAERERLEQEASGDQVKEATAAAQAEAAKPAAARGKAKAAAADQERARAREDAAVKLCTTVARLALAALPEGWGGGDAPEDADTLGQVWGPVAAPYLAAEDGPGGIVLASVVTVQVFVIRIVKARAQAARSLPPAGYDAAPEPSRRVEAAPEAPPAPPAAAASYDPPSVSEGV